MKKKLQSGLRPKVLSITISLLAIMTICIVTIGYRGMHRFMDEIVKDELKKECNLVQGLLRDYDEKMNFVQMDSEGTIFYNTDRETLEEIQNTMDEMRRYLDVEISFFYQDVRVLTTLEDAKGEKIVGTSASSVIVRDVLQTGNSKFYNDAEAFGNRKYVYYTPLKDDTGAVIGMLGVSKNADAVRKSVSNIVITMVLVSVIFIFILGAFSLYLTNILIGRINIIKRFMKNVSEGKLSETMNAQLLKQEDELGELAIIGVTMQKSLRNLIERDALTTLNNRRYAVGRLNQDLGKYKRSGIPYSLCICDIDFFKKVNDTYGHDVGDEVLKSVSHVLRETMLGKGFAARWGGEEFLLVFEMGKYEDHVEHLKHILEQIRALEVTVGDQTVKVTMTMGICDMQEGMGNDEVLSEADKRLYFGKTHGRNQIIAQEI